MVDTVVFGAVTAVYLAIVLFLGYLGYKKTKDAQDFMVAGRKVHPALIAISYGATFISTSAIVGFGGVAAQLGMGLIWLTVLNIGLGIFIAFVIFGKKTRQIGKMLGAVTFPDLMGKRFSSKFMQQASGLIILVGMPLYTSAVMIGGAQFISSTLNLDYNMALLAFAAVTMLYVIGGGLLAVIYTDAFQGALMLIGMIVLLVFTYSMLGGFGAANEALTNLAGQVPAGLAAAGHNGWTAMPDLGSSIWYKMITTIVLGVGIGVLAQPQLVVRFMTAKDGRALNRAVPVGGIFILAMTGIAFTVGALTNVYFYQHFDKIAVVYQSNVDRIMPDFINLALPGWFVVLFMVTLLAAAMSTLSSQFHTMGTAFGHDLLKYTKGYRPSINKNRVGILVMFVISVALAYVMPGSIIARATAMFMGLCASAFLPAFTYGLFSKNPSRKAAIAGLVTGAGAWFLWTVFVHEAESSVLGVCKLLFGTNALLGFPYTVIDPLVVAMPVSIVALAVVWLFTRHTHETGEATEKVPV
ncbi:MAG: sodium/panthothenate symporter [Methanocella sp. PtaU1.Bin125]|nr:MAG: sodium/panthothenate symporter [Methanocella sp. PtaU1.Bin125]